MSLTPAQYRQIIDLCAPHMQTTSTRQSCFDNAFTRNAAFRNDINWEGTTNTFLTHFVNLLLEVHRHNDVHPLRTLLETLKAEYGEDAQRQIDALLPLIDALPPDARLPELPFTIFLSYARADDRTFVRLLYKELTQHGLNVWLDEKNMPNRGLGFEQEIAYAIEQADYLLLICGPKAYESEYVRAEWQHALQHCKPIVPIVRLGDFPPPILGEIGAKPVDAIDMRDDDKFESELKHVVRQLKEQPRPLGALTRVPQPKRWYIERPALRNKIASALLSRDRDNIFSISAIRGLPGVGKSAMAAIVAHDCQVRRTFSDGIVLIEAGVKAKSFELQTRLGMFLGIEAKEFKEDIEFNKALLIARLRDKRMLLILDNVWRKDQVDALQCGVSTLRILFTTRRVELAEQLAEQNNVNISLLEPDEGADLIQRRAGLADDQRSVCRDISRQLNGLTLAVSIAAAKIRASGMQPSEYLASLKDDPNPFSQLTLVRNEFDDPNDPEQHFAASLNLSYRDLDAQDQRRFRQLSVFAPDGTFDAEAAAAVWAVPLEAAQATLNALVDLELVQVEDGRYSQHSLLRAYARALSAADELQAAAARHAEHYLTRHNYGEALDFPPHAAELASDFENIRAALAHGFDHQPERACLFVTALDNGFMQFHQPFAVRRQLLESGLAAAERAGYALGQAHTLRSLGDLERREDNLTAARSCYREALGLFQAIPDRLGQANTLKSLGDLERREDNLTAARSCYREALGLFQAIPSRLGQANTLKSLGDLERREDNLTAARSCYREALGLFQAIPDRLGQAHTLLSLGELERREDNLTAARRCYREALGLFQAIPDRLGQANTLQRLGDLERLEANLTAARSCYREALGLFQAIPDRLGQAHTLKSLGDLESMEANLTAARSCYREALGLFQAIPDRLGQANTLRSLGDLERMEANLTAARSCYREALGLYQAIPDRLGQANTLLMLGDLESMEANLTAARSCYREALGLFQAIPDRLGQAHTLLSLGELESREDNLTAARSCYREALGLYQAIPDRLGQANTLKSLGDLESMEDNLTAARRCYREALGLYQAIPSRLGQANTLLSLGELERMEANLTAARSCYREALGLYQAIPDRLGQAHTLRSLGDLERMEANLTAARSCYREALGLYQAIPDRLGQANTLQSLGDLESREANYPQARSNYLQALELARGIPDLVCQLNSLIGLARLEATLNNRDAACQRYAELFALTDSTPAYANHPVVQEWRREAAQVCNGEAGRSSAAEGIYGVQQREPNQAEMAQLQQLANLIIAWIQTPDWSTSRTYLEEHQDELLTDAAEQALQLLIQANPNVRQLPQHLEILQRARRDGISAAYAQIMASQAQPDLALVQALAAFLQAETDDAARAYLAAHPELLSDEAWRVLGMFQGQDAASQAYLESRRALWRAVKAGQ